MYSSVFFMYLSHLMSTQLVSMEWVGRMVTDCLCCCKCSFMVSRSLLLWM